MRKLGMKVAKFYNGVFYGSTMNGDEDRYGYVSKVDCSEMAYALLERNIALVSPMGRDRWNYCLNLNADDAAIALAIAMNASNVLLMTDVDGIKVNGKAEPKLSVSDLKSLIELKVVNGGMIAKARASIQAAEAGISVNIVNGNSEEALKCVLEGKSCGTVICAEK